MSREDRDRLAAFGGQVRGELARARAAEWIDQAAAGGDPGPMPAAPPGWEAWQARDPEGFGEHLGRLVGDARARRERRRDALEAEAEAELEAAERRARQAAAVVAVVLVLGAVVVVVVRRRRRQRAAMLPEVYRAPETPAPPRYFGLRLGGHG